MRTRRERIRLRLLRGLAYLTRAPAVPSGPEATESFPGRILVLRPDHIGDVLFLTPALRILRQRFPNAQITALVGPWGAGVLSGNPDVDHIMTLPFPGFSRQPKPSPWQPYVLLYHWARHLQGRYDLALVMRFDHWWGALLSYLAKIPLRVGYALPEVAPFLSHPVPYWPGRHEVSQNLHLATWRWHQQTAHCGDGSAAPYGGYSPAEHPLVFPVPEKAQAWAGRSLPDAPFIAIHPGAGGAVKLWRTEGWAVVADRLAHEMGVHIVLTGTAAERSLCQAIAATASITPWIMAGETRLDQLAALFSRSRLVLGVDSGPLHLAVATGVPTVHLYGPVDPVSFGPWGDPQQHRVLRSAWPCVPCDRIDYSPAESTHHPCVREIEVEAVIAAARAGWSA
jgi:ADP-heptose:LPS heptosyltransferase